MCPIYISVYQSIYEHSLLYIRLSVCIDSVKQSTGHTHTGHTDREHPPDTGTHTRTTRPPNEHLPQALNNAQRWRERVVMESFVVLFIRNSKPNHLGAQGIGFTQYCHYQYCMVYDIQTGVGGEGRILRKSCNSIAMM